jgi:tRNA(adenine34) deaminase
MPNSRGVTDEFWIRKALDEARDAGTAGEVPVAALIVRADQQLSLASNKTISSVDPSAHAEMLAIRSAALALQDWRLTGCTLYITLEPCAMCAGAIVLARLDRVVFGAWDDKAGMAGSRGNLLRHPALNHRPEVLGGVLASECGELLNTFFSARRGGSAAAESL